MSNAWLASAAAKNQSPARRRFSEELFSWTHFSFLRQKDTQCIPAFLLGPVADLANELAAKEDVAF